MKSILSFTAASLAFTSIINAALVTVREGLNGYSGSADTELYSLSAATPLGSELEVSIDADNGGGVSQALLKFDSLIGNGANQVPADATINSATLTLQITSAGSGINFHRVLQSWAEGTATWDSFVGGIQADGLEAAITPTLSLGGNNGGSNILSGPLAVNLTADVQAWANGAANNGWALLPFVPNGTNGVDFVSKEGASILGFPTGQPTLTIDYTPIPEPLSATAGFLLLALRRRAKRA